MRHKRRVSTFGRDKDGRKALIRNLVISLVEHGRITTTLAKAKELRRHAERAVTVGKRGSTAARHVLYKRFPNNKTVKSLLTDLAPRFADRNGGYTRIIKLAPRAGDGAKMALIEWIDYDGVEGKVIGTTAKAAADAKEATKKAPKKKAAKKKAAKKAK